MSAVADNEKDSIIEAIGEGNRVLRIDVVTQESGELLVAAKVVLHGERSLRDAADHIEDIKIRIRAAVPAAQSIYIEPGIYRPANDPAPPTDVFVLRSSN